MRWSPSFLGISLAAHVLAGVAIYAEGRAPAASPAAAPPEPEALFSGDTFEVPVELPAPVAEPALGAPVVVSPADPRPLPRPRGTARAPSSEARTGGGESRAGSVFGASGERAAVDLATAFTRGFPQAASTDASWLRAPFGSAGEATVVLEIDETGALVSSQIQGTPGPALRAGITRTLVLIGARAFTSTARVIHLRVTGRVSADEVHDGLHGDVFAVGGSFDRGVGSAFFALAVGRRIDVRVAE